MHRQCQTSCQPGSSSKQQIETCRLRVQWPMEMQANASRLNSYTQQLCVNDAVVRDNKTSATEKELSPKLPKGSKISQQVTFTSKFVEHASEVREAMNISSALKIKYGDSRLCIPRQCPHLSSENHAILTKYSTLRSYQLLSNKGSALDYENAGVYTNSLPESYLKYKSIWRTIQSMSEDLAKESKSLQKRSNAASISAFIKATVEEVKGLTKDNNEKKLMDTLPQTAYDATITSLERARRCSRLQMIRIVQEVDAVSNGPSVAIDPDQVGRFLSPVLFQQLLPTVEPVVTEEDFEKWKYEHKELQKRVNSLEESTKELKETTEAHSKSINTAQHSTTKEDFDNQNSEHQKLQGKIESLEERTKELKETTEGHSKSIDVLKLKMNFISHNEVDD